MPPRLRSKPYGPNSPNAAQALPEPPRRRRATRSASAQPQEDQPAPPVREPRARKTRGKAASRGKKATRATSFPTPSEDPQQEELEGDETTSGAAAQSFNAKVESPQFELGASQEHDEPYGTNGDEPPVDQMQGVQTPTSRSPSEGPSADESVADQDRPDLEMQERPATPSVEIPVTVLPSIEPSDPELMTPAVGVLRSTETASSRRHSRTGGSPSSSSEQSRVLRAQGATPIRRSHANRSNSRRIESRGSLGRTLYRLPQLLSFGSQSELQDNVEEANRADEHDSLENAPQTAAPEATPPSTPERAPPATPVAPLTAPPAGTDVSPGWSRWIFNGVSRRWTVLRGRFAHDDDNRNEATEPNVPTVPDSSAEDVSAATATTSPIARAVVTDSSIASSASPAKANRPGSSPVNSDAQRKSPLNRPQPLFIPQSRIPPQPRPRRRSASFVDSRDLLGVAGPKSANDPYAYETQREFVKRRQDARAERDRQIREAKAREEAKAASASQVTSNSSRSRGPIFFFSSPNQTTPITASIDPASRTKASEAAAVQATKKSNADTENQNTRKRSRGFGLDEDDLAVHQEDFTPQEWEALRAQVEKAEQDAAKAAAQQSAPPNKKRRVDQSSKQKKRTQQSARRQSTGTPRQTMAPNRSPGYVPNPRQCFAVPELSPIDSSRLLTDPESPSNPQTPQASTRRASRKCSKSGRTGSSKKAEDENDETGDETNDLQDPSPLSRARNMAEQFKPKTPSRLRESARIPNSNASTPAALGFSSPSFLGVSTNHTPLHSDAMSMDGSSFVANPDATQTGTQATTQSVSTDTRRGDDAPLQPQTSSTAVAANTIESAEHSLADDVAWLKETLPSGNLDELQWPERRSLVEALDIHPEAVEIVERNWPEKGPELMKYVEAMWEAFQAAPDQFEVEPDN